MEPINKKSPNCVPVPAECTQWNSGNIDFLGVCNGDYLPKIIWEIVNQLKKLAGDDLSEFDIDGLLTICNEKAPKEVDLISVLTLLRNNQICLKDYILSIQETLVELAKDKAVNVNLKCLADIDNFGNQLSVTRQSLDQIVIDKLCNHEERITVVEGRITELQNELDNQTPPTYIEPSISTCLDGTPKAVSLQVQTTAQDVCDINDELGTDTISTALAKTPSAWNSSEFTSLPGWIIAANPLYGTLAASYNNLLLAYDRLRGQVADILATCCAPTCDKIKIGFSIVAGDDPGDYIVRFRPTDGTELFGFTDMGTSTITFTGTSITTGVEITQGPVTIKVSTTEADWDDNIYNLSAFDISKPITVSIKANIQKDGLVCEKCIGKLMILNFGCEVCKLTASGEKGDAGTITVTYEYE